MNEIEKCEEIEKIINFLKKPYVFRKDVKFFINPRTMANLDCKKQGPSKKYLISKKIAYDTYDFANWFVNKSGLFKIQK